MYNYETATVFIGSLTALDGGGIIDDVTLEIDKRFSQKLVDALRTGRVTRDNQDLFFKTVNIPKNQLELFTKGQSSWIKTENGYSLTSAPQHRVRFRGDFQTLIRASDGYVYAFSVRIGGIEFNIGEKKPDISDDVVEYNNVETVVFPVGTYKIEKLGE